MAEEIKQKGDSSVSETYKGTDSSWWKTSPGAVGNKSSDWKRCYEENHKPLKIGGGTFLGGNCGSPIVSDYDVYIGLDNFSYKPRSQTGYPWVKATKTKKEGPEFDFMFKITDMDRCAELFPIGADARIVAGAPLANDVLKCALKPVDPNDYSMRLSAEQLGTLQRVFPEGVCNWSRPGVGQVPLAGTWAVYAGHGEVRYLRPAH